jgi:phenylacetate-CoA ligase
MEYYDQLEIQEPAVREERIAGALPVQIANAQQNSPAFAKILDGVDAAGITSREALARLPVTRKSELQEKQKQDPPFGGLVAVSLDKIARLYQSPGPIYDPDARRSDYWRFARAMFAAGFRKGELIHNTFSYHFTPAGFMAETGGQALGCTMFPAGIGQTELQVKAIADLKSRGYVGTPSFLRIILEKAEEMAADVSSLSKALVSAEALPPSLREEFNKRGVNVLQCYATADLGMISYESPALEGMIVDEAVIVEIVRPGTGDPVPEGEVGELVITTFNPEYPLIRFGTGDLSAVLPGTSPCGRTNTRIKGWMGRADQTTKVKGMFVRPTLVAEVLKRHPEVIKGRLVIDQQDYRDIMTLHCELQGEGDDSLQKALVTSIRDVCKLRGEVKFVAPNSLPNDGKVIDDIRKYE